MFVKSFLIQFKSKNFMVDCERIGSLKKINKFLSEKFINKSDLSVGWEVGTSVMRTIEIYLKHEEGSKRVVLTKYKSKTIEGGGVK